MNSDQIKKSTDLFGKLTVDMLMQSNEGAHFHFPGYAATNPDPMRSVRNKQNLICFLNAKGLQVTL